jgi:hypothetical protein
MSGRDISAAKYAVAITPSDVTVIPEPRGIYVGVAGDVAMVLPGKTGAVTFRAMTNGEHPFAPIQIMATGTTATDILALY